jgi:hypothetical protein
MRGAITIPSATVVSQAHLARFNPGNALDKITASELTATSLRIHRSPTDSRRRPSPMAIGVVAGRHVIDPAIENASISSRPDLFGYFVHHAIR